MTDEQRQSLENEIDAVRTLAQSTRLRLLLAAAFGLVSGLGSAYAYVEAHDANLVRRPELVIEQSRITALELALAVANQKAAADRQALSNLQAAYASFVKQYKGDEVEVWRKIMLASVPHNRSAEKKAQRDYDAERKEYPPPIAADRAISWSRPPGY